MTTPGRRGKISGGWIVAALLGAVVFLASGAPSRPAWARDESPPKREPYRDPAEAALRSVVFPGWGQHYNDEPSKGYLFLGTALAGIVIGSRSLNIAGSEHGAALERAVGWSIYGFAAIVGSYDAYTTAVSLNRENGYNLQTRLFDDGFDLQPPALRLRVALLHRRF